MLRRKVALKILRRRDADASQLRCFEREARCASMLNHPNIVTVFDVGYEDELQYIATEHVDGETLRERLDRGPMTAAEAVDLAFAVPHGLLAAHQRRGIHPDIKPADIKLGPD